MSSDLNLNKIAAAVLLAGLIGMVAGKATEFLYDGGPEHPGHHEEGPRGFKIDVVEDAGSTGGTTAIATAADISALYPTADAKAGEEYVAKKCTVCHNVNKGEGNKVGPHLYGAMGRKPGSVADFAYSKGMVAHGGEVAKWDFDALNHFLWNPKKTVPGTLMAFAGIPKDQERANVIAYLNTMTDTPQTPPKPGAAAPAAEKPADTAAKAAENPANNKETPGAKAGNIEAAKADEKTPAATTKAK